MVQTKSLPKRQKNLLGTLLIFLSLVFALIIGNALDKDEFDVFNRIVHAPIDVRACLIVLIGCGISCPIILMWTGLKTLFQK